MRSRRCCSALAGPLAGALAGALLFGAFPLRAQQTAPSAVTRADSMAELVRLDSLVLAPSVNAATWHARGLLAWQLAQGKRAVGNRVDREQSRLTNAADSSLLLATTLEPRNTRYIVDFATYRSQGSPMVRAGATRYMRRAMDVARASGDSLVIAQMADALGMLSFREYQTMFGRRMSLDNGPSASIAEILVQQSGSEGRAVSANADLVRQTIESRSTLVGGNPPPGVEAYDDALEYFETATHASPSLPLPWRHRFAALADRKRWEELEVAARARLGIAPWDPDAWLALGLARHRGGTAGALAAFDSAFAQMADSTRRRLDRVERIMRPKAVQALEALPSADRARTERFVWTAADPLWSVPGNEVRAEYLARVAFAELRYTDEELGLHGVDTYPGDLHVRYGFPQVTANFKCDGGDAESPSMVCLFWWFAPRVQFMVHYQPIFNRGRAAMDDIAVNEELIAQAPATWTGVPNLPTIDSIPLRIARFRADGARPSVLVSGAVPLQHMSVEGVRASATTMRFWMFADAAEIVARDSARTGSDGLAQWKLRVPPGELYVRAEALVPGGGAARGTALVPSPTSGAGLAMSDVVVAASAVDGATPARRWYELVIAPAPDTLPRARSIALAWEIYGLAARDGTQRYTVRLVIEKSSKSVAGRIAAQIGGLVGLQRGDDHVTLDFDRDGAARDVTLDHIALSLREAPAGRYTLTVVITDKVSGSIVRRAVPLLIGP